MPKNIDERAFQLALQVLTLGRDNDYRRAARWKVISQLIAAATSVGANLTEASAAQTKRDFVAKVSIAKKEALETQYWLRLADESNLVDGGDLSDIRREAAEVGKIISAIVRRAKETDRRG